MVDLYGQTADYHRLTATCSRYGLAMVEDAAQALDATHRARPAGPLAPLAAFSFNGNTLITTSAGAMLTQDADLAHRALELATHAPQPVPHHEHLDVGMSCRLSNVLAAIGRSCDPCPHGSRTGRGSTAGTANDSGRSPGSRSCQLHHGGGPIIGSPS